MGSDRGQPDTAGATIDDVAAPGLRVLFCGINPGLMSAATGCHFARPGNRFWKALHGAGFTDRVLFPSEQRELLDAGLGITNLVARSTATAAEITTAELRAGAASLRSKVSVLAPAVVAFLGMGAYRQAFGRPRAGLGHQPEDLGPAAVWLLPNPSGLQARYQLAELVGLFSELRAFATARPGRVGGRDPS
jgi:TDG/mug DNA glycosylase family protein